MYNIVPVGIFETPSKFFPCFFHFLGAKLLYEPVFPSLNHSVMSVIVFLIWSITQVYRFKQKKVFSTIYISFCYTLIHFLFISYSFIKWLLFCYIAEFLPVPIFVCLFVCLMAYLSIWLLPYVALLHYYGQFVLVFVHIFIQRSFGDKILKDQPMKFYL